MLPNIPQHDSNMIKHIIANLFKNESKAKQMAIDEGLMFIVLHSSRWMGEDDPLRPKEKEYNLGYKGYIRPDVGQKR